jgi:hypothetical protein
LRSSARRVLFDFDRDWKPFATNEKQIEFPGILEIQLISYKRHGGRVYERSWGKTFSRFGVRGELIFLPTRSRTAEKNPS